MSFDINILEKMSGVIKNVHEKQKEKQGVMELLAPFGRHLENPNSDLIAYLLDPNARHNQGTKYLKLFLETLKINDSELKNAIVTREHITNEYRRIDIVITLENKVIIIESKINAGEQNNQLDDYYEFIKSQFPNKEIHLLFLTRFSQETYTLSDENKVELTDRFQNITWGGKVLQWLEKILTQLDYNKEPILKSAVEQYIYSLKVLTNQTKEDNEMMKALFENINDQNIEDIINSVQQLVPYTTLLKCKNILLKKGGQFIWSETGGHLDQLKECDIDEFISTEQKIPYVAGVWLKDKKIAIIFLNGGDNQYQIRKDIDNLADFTKVTMSDQGYDNNYMNKI